MCMYTSVYYVYSLIPSLHTANDKKLGRDLARDETLYRSIFSGFSVGFCIYEEKVICYQLELGK